MGIENDINHMLKKVDHGLDLILEQKEILLKIKKIVNRVQDLMRGKNFSKKIKSIFED